MGKWGQQSVLEGPAEGQRGPVKIRSTDRPTTAEGIYLAPREIFGEEISTRSASYNKGTRRIGHEE